MLSRTPLILLLAALFASGCFQVKHSKTEQRVVVLPAGNPGATLGAAQTICGEVSGGLGKELQQHFPKLTPPQMQGVFVTANEGTFPKGGHQVFITTGIHYQEPLANAKAIADVCEEVVRDAVETKFTAAGTTHPGTP